MKRIGVKNGILIFLLVFLSSVIYGQEQAVPLKGEGVNAFLNRNNRSGKENYQKFLELNKGKLGKGNSLKAGVRYKLPPSSAPSKQSVAVGKKGKQLLFGPKLADYTIESDRLKGACFYLVAGHGGPDPGAIGRIGNKELHEDEYAYDIVLRLARALLMEGATVHIIIQDAKDGIRDDQYLDNSKRETCVGASIPLNQIQRLKQRCDKINALSKKQTEKYQRAIFVHLDSRSKKHQLDAFFYHHEKSVGGKELANTLKTTLKEHYDKHQPARGFTGTVSSRNLYVLRNTNPVAVLAELGNIQNSFDQRRFLLSSNRQALANWICRGFIRDYENFKKKKK